MSAPVVRPGVCALGAVGRCRSSASVFAAAFDRSFEREMPSHATVPDEVKFGSSNVGKNMTVYMQYPEWKTSGAV